MTKVIRWWEKMSFWDKMERTLGLSGAIIVEELARHEAPYWIFMIIGILGFVGKSIHIWAQDTNNNGIVDSAENN